MSSTKRGSQRENNDFYESPAWTVHRLLEKCKLPGGLWLEPCAGKGAIIKAVNVARGDVRWFANEIDEAHVSALHDLEGSVGDFRIGDARDICFVKNTFPKVIITNPPFNVAEKILRHMLALGGIVVFLQRLNWCGGPRAELFEQLEPSVYVLPDRPSFKETTKIKVDKKTGKPRKVTTGQDSIEYAWWVFDGKGQFRMLANTPNEVRHAEKMARREMLKQLKLAA